MKKKLLRKRVIIPVVLIVIVIILYSVGRSKTANMLFREEAVAYRDLTTYLKFTGKVEAKDTAKVYSSISGKIKQVVVEEGQKVNKGDVICYFDSDDIEYAIKSKEASLEQTKTMNEYNLKDAKTSLYNLQSSVNQGLNASVNMAQKTLLNEQDMYYAKVEAYNAAMETYLKTKADYDSGKLFETASNAVNDAQRTLDNYNKTVELTDEMSGNAPKNDLAEYNEKYQRETLERAVSQTQKKLEDAKKSAQDTVNNLKEQADTAYENVVKAEANMESAKRDYDTALLTVNQNLQTMRNTVEKIEATASTKTQELDIEHTKDSLDNYVIKATMDGYITTLNCKEGELFTSTMPVAVISNFDNMEISVKVDEYDIGKVSKDMPVSIYVNAFDKDFTGKVESMDMTATSTNDVSFFNAKVSFDTDGTVMSGLSAEAKIVNLDKKGVLTLLQDAISYEIDNTAYCMVKGEKGEQIKTVLTLGDSDGTYIEILSGLSEGDVVYYVPKNAMQLLLEN